MQKIIGKDNRVNYGCFDEPLDFNYGDFKLYSFFNKEITGLKKKFSLHTFNYLGIIADDFLVGIAAVNLGYIQNVFAYIYHYRNGKIFEYDTKSLGSGPLKFPVNPDEHVIRFEKRGASLFIAKSHDEKILSVDAGFGGRLSVRGTFPYSFKNNQPLRVLNPSDPTHWTFTEKCAPIMPKSLIIELDNAPLPFDLSRTTLLYDWSGGYMRRETNWYWAAFAGITKGKKKMKIGLNLAALVNESFYSENAFWVDGKRTRIPRCIYDFNPADPYEPWHIFDEEGKVDITFRPMGERKERINAMIIKTTFRQFIGTFEGTIRPDKGSAVTFDSIHGFTELHKALW
jgi:hypothetical protein